MCDGADDQLILTVVIEIQIGKAHILQRVPLVIVGGQSAHLVLEILVLSPLLVKSGVVSADDLGIGLVNEVRGL